MKKLIPLLSVLLCYGVSILLLIVCSNLFLAYENINPGIGIVTGISVMFLFILCIIEVGIHYHNTKNDL